MEWGRLRREVRRRCEQESVIQPEKGRPGVGLAPRARRAEPLVGHLPEGRRQGVRAKAHIGVQEGESFPRRDLGALVPPQPGMPPRGR